MAKGTRIEWTDGGATWNPWYCCREVSTGCSRCYARWGWAHRVGRPWGKAIRAAPSTFELPLRLKPRTDGKPAFVFTCSLSDFFIEDADPWRDEAWAIMRRTPRLTYQVLTKRPERILSHLPPIGSLPVFDKYGKRLAWPWPWPNVWLGATTENQSTADMRIPILLKVPVFPASLRFLSCEPLLGPLDLRPWLSSVGIGWVLIGGESSQGGRAARELELSWVRGILDQCREARVPAFVKQLGRNPADGGRSYSFKDRKGGDPNEWPTDLRVRGFPVAPTTLHESKED